MRPLASKPGLCDEKVKIFIFSPEFTSVPFPVFDVIVVPIVVVIVVIKL